MVLRKIQIPIAHPDDTDEALRMLRDNGDEQAAIVDLVKEIENESEYLKVSVR